VFVVICELGKGDARLLQETQHVVQVQEILSRSALHVPDAAAPVGDARNDSQWHKNSTLAEPSRQGNRQRCQVNPLTFAGNGAIKNVDAGYPTLGQGQARRLSSSPPLLSAFLDLVLSPGIWQGQLLLAGSLMRCNDQLAPPQ
jgi:hypothetical protein